MDNKLKKEYNKGYLDGLNEGYEKATKNSNLTGNQLQEVKSQFTEELFEVMKNEMDVNNNDLFDYYNLIITNLDKHNDLFEDILQNGLNRISYINESMGYTDGNITVYLNNDIKYDINFIWEEETIGDSYENEECIIHKKYCINKTTLIKTMSENDVDKEKLQQTQEETERKLKESRLKQKQCKLSKLLEEKKQLDIDIDQIKDEIFDLTC